MLNREFGTSFVILKLMKFMEEVLVYSLYVLTLIVRWKMAKFLWKIEVIVIVDHCSDAILIVDYSVTDS